MCDWHLTGLSVISKYKNFKKLGKEKFEDENQVRFVHPDNMYLPISKKHLRIFQKIFSEKLRKITLTNEGRVMPSISEILLFSEFLMLNTMNFDMKKYGIILDFIVRLKEEFQDLREVFDEEIGAYCQEMGYDYWLDFEIGETPNRPNL